MATSIHKVIGPEVKTAKKGDAVAKLLDDPQFKRLQASLVDVTEEDGKWVAHVKVAQPPFDEGDDDEEAGPPKKKSPPKDEGDDSGSDDSDDGPPGLPGDPAAGLEPKKPSVEEQVSHLTQLVTQIATALGVGGHASPVPGHDGPPGPGGPPPPGGPPGGPPGHGGPPGAARPMHPGDAPPGTTPLGAPAFASVNQVPNDHPWKDMLFHARTFKASDRTNASQAEIQSELTSLAEPFGYRVAQVHEGVPDGSGYRDIEARITNLPSNWSQ